MSSERRTLQELVGVSLHASNLRIASRSDSGETALLRVAALGAAMLHVQHGADGRGPSGGGGSRSGGGTLAEVVADPAHRPSAQDQVLGELAGALYHLRYGGQHELVGQTVTLFAAYIGMRQRFGQGGFLGKLAPIERAGLIRRFATRALHEWLSDRCIACGGCGRLERASSGSWIRPRGLMKRNAVFQACRTCHGSGLAMPSHTARRAALGIGLEQYEREAWAQHFRAAFTWLARDVGRLYRPLTAQLERSKKRD